MEDDEYYSDELLEEEMGDYVFVDDEDEPQWIRSESLAKQTDLQKQEQGQEFYVHQYQKESLRSQNIQNQLESQETKSFIASNFAQQLNPRGDVISPIKFDDFFDRVNNAYPEVFMNHMEEERFGQWKGLLIDMFREKLRNVLTLEMDTTQIALS